MPETKYQKLDIAVEYLNLASSLWLSDSNLFSSAHLAGAAEEISGQYCRLNGYYSHRDWWVKFGNKFIELDVFEGVTGKKLADLVYLPKNTIKHMTQDSSDTIVSLDVLEVAADLIRGAYKNFETLESCHLLSKDVKTVIEKTTIYI